VIATVVSSYLSFGLSWASAYIDHRDDDRERDVKSKNQRWRAVLDALHLGLGLSQIIYGFALWVCAASIYGNDSQDLHAVLAYALSFLAAFSYRPMRPAYRAQYRRVRSIRGGISWFYMMMLIVTGLVKNIRDLREARPERPGYDLSAYFGFWSMAFLSRDLMFENLKKDVAEDSRHRSWHRLVMVPLEVLINVVPFSWTVVHILYLKFGRSPDCNMRNSEEDQWTVGQMLSMLMLAASLFPGLDAYACKATTVEDSDF
jgi:hypothetical protein